MSEFQRSNLTIQPKQRLMSAGAFISPVRTYDANEQMRIVESFRGLSAQSDALIDGFIKKKQEEAQAKADMYMTDALLDTNHPEHKKAKEMMNSLKPQAANLLGVDFWTQQYISRAQAEQLFNKEKAVMELGYNENGDANKSPDEYVEQLGKYRAELEKEVATYPQMVQKYFYKMPRAELMSAMRDKHIKDVSSQQIELRNNIASNKVYDTLENTVDGLSAVLYNMPDLEDETLSNIQYGKYLSGDNTREEAAMVARLYNWDGVIDKAGKFMPVEQQADILQFRKLSNSPIIDKLLENMRESAEAGMTPEQIKQSVYNGFIRMVQDNEDLGDEADILFNIVMDRANKDTALQEKSGSWGYTNNNNMTDDKNAALFDMSDIAVKGKSLRQIAAQSAGLKQAEYEAKQIKDRQAVWAFLNDAELAGKISKQDILYKSADDLADKLGMNRVEAGEFIENWRQKRISSITVPVNESHFYQYDKWLSDIRKGKITSIEQLDKGLEQGEFHPRHYDALADELGKGGLNPKQEKLKNELEQSVMRYLKAVYPDNPRKVETLFITFQNDIYDALMNGDITNIVNGNDFLAKSYAVRGLDSAQYELSSSEELSTPQTRSEFQQSVADRMSKAAIVSDDKNTGKKKVVNQGWFNPYLSYEEWRAGQGQELKDQYPYMSEEVLRKMYDDQQGYFENFKDEERQEYFIKLAKNKDIDKEGLKHILKTNPDAVTKAFNGIEIDYIDGLLVPKDKKLRDRFVSIVTNPTMNRSKTEKREIELLRSFTNINGDE